MRSHSTRSNGSSFDNDLKSAVWWKGRPIQGRDNKVEQMDVCGRAIRWAEYGNTSSPYGWEIDHIKPVAAGGTDDLSNLQPLYWETNRKKADTYPWNCTMA